MQIVGKAKAFSAACAAVKGAVTGRSSMPILSHILVVADSDGVTVVGTDLELLIKSQVPDLTVLDPGCIAIPYKASSELFSKLPPGADVTAGIDKGYRLTTTCNKQKAAILSLPGEDYPKLDRENYKYVINDCSGDLIDSIQRTAYAASIDTTRVVICGVSLQWDGNELSVIATDTHRLVRNIVQNVTVTNKDGKTADRFSIILPAAAVKSFTTIAKKTDRPIFHVGDTYFSVVINELTTISSRLVDGEFPNVTRVIPDPSKSEFRFMVNTSELKGAALSVFPVAKENSNRVVLTFNFREGKLRLSASAQTVGDIEDEVSIVTKKSEADNMVTAVNVAYLIDQLSSSKDEHWFFDMTGPLKPYLCRPAVIPEPEPGDDPSPELVPSKYSICVLMPMQLS